MALTFKFDEQQAERFITAVNNLSDNIAKWQGSQADATKQGFSDLIDALGGTSEEQLQAMIDSLATNLNLSTDVVENAVKQFQSTKGGQQNGT
jgi:hypothetical protein